MKPSQVKLFTNQPRITKKDLDDLEKRGLIVPPKSEHKGDRRKAEVANPSAGQVVGYALLAAALSKGEVTQDDARRLLVIEALRPNGRPRGTHLERLLVAAFAQDKADVLDKIRETSREAWEKNRQ